MTVDSKNLQTELFQMLKSFHEVCIKNKLTYYMVCGTFLGAVRHKGFIPWDDDVDVGMPRKDYDKFCKLAKKILPQNYEIRYYQNSKGLHYHFVKLMKSDSTLIERNLKKGNVGGLYIDVFPLDNLDDYSFLGKIRSKSIWFLHSLERYHCTTERKPSLLKDCIHLFSKIVPLAGINFVLEKLLTCNNNEKSNFICNYLAGWSEKEVLPRSVWGKPTFYKFENAEFYGPEQAEKYLTKVYGNYMQPPPVKDRVYTHNYSYVNLNKPYKEYLRENP